MVVIDNLQLDGGSTPFFSFSEDPFRIPIIRNHFLDPSFFLSDSDQVLFPTKAKELPPTMCHDCDRIAEKCRWISAPSEEEYFLTLPRRAKAFSTPPLRPFLLELANSLEKTEQSIAVGTEKKRARDAAGGLEKTPVIGTIEPP